MKDDCAPHVPKFFPEKSFSDEELKYPSEDLIYSMMSWGKFRLAYDTYLRCKDLGINVTEPCKLALLDFLCIHNSKEETNKLPIQETWFTNESLNEWQMKKLAEQSQLSSWKTGGEADLMFKELETKSAEAYCSLIKGMAKYLDDAGAIKHYKEMQDLGFKPDLSTCNELIKLTKHMKITNKGKMDHIMQLLVAIKTNGITPNLCTFNNTLYTICSFGIDQESVVFTLNILKEMEFLKIEPSLATWNHVLEIFYPARAVGDKTNILPQILDQVERADMSKEGLVWKDINDSHFFKTAMDKCLNHRQNGPHVRRIHSILMRNNNIKFLNKEELLNRYFDCYFFSIMKYEEPEVVVKEWRTLTPYIHSRSIKIMSKMIQYIFDFQCFDVVPEIWSDFVEGKFRRDKAFSVQSISLFLDLMVHYEPNQDQQGIDSLMSQYGTIAEIMIKSYPYVEPPRKFDNVRSNEDENRPIYVFEFKWSGKMLSNFFIICAKANKIDICAQEFEVFLKNDMKISEELSESCLKALFEAFYNHRNVEKAIAVLKLASKYQLSREVQEFTTLLRSLGNLSDDEKQMISELKGKYVKKN